MESNPIPGRATADPFADIDADLELLESLPPAEQVPVLGRIHTGLTNALSATAASSDSGPLPPGRGR